MSFVTAIKDYIDLLNNVYDSVSGDINVQQIIQHTFLYIYASIKYILFYFLSFQWLKDLAYLPVLVPQLSTSILKENYFLETPISNFFTFLEIPSYSNNKFLIGFLNSFFTCLPLSTAHFICLRRLLVQGIPAGVASSLGTIFGQISFLFCVLFGLRFFIIPWFSFEPLSYIFGIILILIIVYEMAHERAIRLIDISARSTLFKIFLLNFALTWTEQSCIFQYFGNLTLGADPTILEIFSSTSEIQSIFIHGSYLTGMFIGSIFFTLILGFGFLNLTNFVLKLSALPYSKWIKNLNFTLLTGIIAFSFTSIPFYGLDYLLLGPLGFVSQDKAFENTLFSTTTVKDTNEVLGGNSSFKSLDTDITPFDRGKYLQLDSNDSFEELNYQGEYAWTTKQDRRALYQIAKSRKLISDFFQKTNKEGPKSQSENKNIASFTKNSQEVGSTKELRDRKGQASSSSEQNFISNRLKTEKTNLTSSEQISNQNNFSDLEDFDESDKSDGLSDYFFKLNERLNNDSKITETLAPLMDVSFSEQFIEETSKNSLEKKIKQKYYSNPVYKILLSTDIDSFLMRQSSFSKLSPNQEKDLFQKRIILSNYYDSLRYYKKLPYSEDFQSLFNGSKSYADRIYNQQFKGTLKIVRRLFATTLDDEETLNKKLILKFDQPLYKHLLNTSSNEVKRIPSSDTESKEIEPNEREVPNRFNGPNPLLHEELNIFGSVTSKEGKEGSKLVLPKTQAEEHEKNSNTLNKKNAPFIQLTNPIPFYTGWDEQLRKLVITNRLIPRSVAGSTLRFQGKTKNNDYVALNALIKTTKKIDFTTWPVSKSILEKPRSESKIPYVILFESLNDPQNKMLADSFNELNDLDWNLDTVPANMKKINPDKISEVIPPTRGGFIWPGQSSLKINIKDLLKK